MSRCFCAIPHADEYPMPPAVLLRDTPEDRERFYELWAKHMNEPGHPDRESCADILFAALRGTDEPR